MPVFCFDSASIAMNLARAQSKPIFLHKDSVSSFFSQPHIWEKVHFCVFTLHISFSCNWLNNCRCKQIMNVLPFSIFFWAHKTSKDFHRLSAYPGPSLDTPRIRSREFVIYMPAASFFFPRTVEARHRHVSSSTNNWIFKIFGSTRTNVSIESTSQKLIWSTSLKVDICWLGRCSNFPLKSSTRLVLLQKVNLSKLHRHRNCSQIYFLLLVIFFSIPSLMITSAFEFSFDT